MAHRGLHDPELHAIPRLLASAAGRLPYFGVLGDQHPTPGGSFSRGYFHVSDLAEAHRRA